MSGGWHEGLIPVFPAGLFTDSAFALAFVPAGRERKAHIHQTLWSWHMNTLAKKVQTFFADEQGATAVEYGLMAALIAVAIIAAVSGVGAKLVTLFEKISEKLTLS